ncbi:MAG: aspartate/glutamate racemase family protein [Collinsella sp.]
MHSSRWAVRIAIPCNTSHYFYDQIQSFTKVPIIHMPRESVRAMLRLVR